MVSVSFEPYRAENVFSPIIVKSWHRVRGWLWIINWEGSERKRSLSFKNTTPAFIKKGLRRHTCNRWGLSREIGSLLVRLSCSAVC